MNLRLLRKQKKMTQQDVANHLVCTPGVYSRYETGAREPSIETLIILANLFDVSVDYLIGRQAIDYAGLSIYENTLVTAARSADARAREDALNILMSHETRD